MAVGADQYGSWSGNRPDGGKLPRAIVLRVDQLNALCPWRDVETARLAEVEQQGPSIVQQGEEPERAVGGDQIEIRHAPPEQRMARPEIVVDAEPRHERGEPLARLVHPEELGDDAAQSIG